MECWIKISVALGLLLSTPVLAKAEDFPSICFGTPAQGRLENGQRLPPFGKNFTSYSWVGWALGRTAVHSRVNEVVVATYRKLGEALPEKTYVFGETGWPQGGLFRPHKTHQNGLSADFMVPVFDSDGKSVPLPTNIFNKWGYGIEFDSNGKYKNLTIDFESLAAHLYYLDQVAKAQGIKMRRVIFDPPLLQRLYSTRYGPYLSKNVSFSKARPWVRHDEHYHVDFDLPCRPL